MRVAIASLFCFAACASAPLPPSDTEKTAAATGSMAQAPSPEETPTEETAPPDLPDPMTPEPPAPPTGVPVFVATGHQQRTALSCDAGLTWHDVDTARTLAQTCTGGFDCGHSSGANRGLTFGGGFVFSTFGWGADNGAYRSANGRDWQKISPSAVYAMLAYGRDMLMANYDPPQKWENAATTPSPLTATPGGNTRLTAFVADAVGRFVLINGSGISSLYISDDRGASWRSPDSIDADKCLDHNIMHAGGVAYANGKIVVVGYNGGVCVSDDGGESFTSPADSGIENLSSRLLVHQDTFHVWGYNAVYRSTDGTTWSATPLVGTNNIHKAASNGVDTFVGTRDDYETQKFFRSTDGISWTEATSYPQGHPINFMAHGHLDTCVTP